MFLMTGPSGAGKTTLAKRLIRERNLQYFSIEHFYAAFFGSELVHKHKDDVWAAFAIALKVAMDDGADILVDTNSPSRADREWFVERFPDFSFNLIVVDAPKEICFKNNKSRERVIPDEDMEAIFARLEPVTDEEMKHYDSVEFYQNTDNSGVKFVKKLK